MERVDQFDSLMEETIRRSPNPVITGYKDAIEDIKAQLEKARKDTLYMAITGLPSIVEMVLIHGVPYLMIPGQGLVVDKVFCCGKTYTITEPIKLSVSVVVNGHGTVWDVFPRYGFHLLDSKLCLGDYAPPIVKRWSECIEVGSRIKKLLSGINCDSLGHIKLPQEYEMWKDVKNNPCDFVESMVRRNKLTEVNIWT